MKVTLIRHTSVNVAPGTCYGHTDVPLNDTFEEEARTVAQRLESSPFSDESFDAVYTSPLSRCRRLAKWCGYPQAEIEDSLKELNFGRWEMQRFEEISDPELQLWFDDWFSFPAGGGESMADQYERVKAFLNRCASEGKENILLFTHGGVILCALLLVERIALDHLFDSLPPYGDIIRINYPS
ncbi:MAG: alpha-ribazole phosphatase [Bacteroidales bacterium]|nr:alpha-ribazole phosphatase [Bacteroidales bacterium]